MHSVWPSGVLTLYAFSKHLPDANDARELSNQAVAAPHNDAFDIILNSAARKITKAVKNHMQSTVFRFPPACWDATV
jgi:hypothetical protein